MPKSKEEAEREAAELRGLLKRPPPKASLTLEPAPPPVKPFTVLAKTVSVTSKAEASSLQKTALPGESARAQPKRQGKKPRPLSQSQLRLADAVKKRNDDLDERYKNFYKK